MDDRLKDISEEEKMEKKKKNSSLSASFHKCGVCETLLKSRDLHISRCCQANSCKGCLNVCGICRDTFCNRCMDECPLCKKRICKSDLRVEGNLLVCMKCHESSSGEGQKHTPVSSDDEPYLSTSYIKS